MTDTQIAKALAREMHTIIAKAVDDGANPGDVFSALEYMIIFWMSFLDDRNRKGAARELKRRIPQMLKDANSFAAAVDNSDGVPNFHRH
jgi:hypothetical protein